jgi:FkbM family methyltransferase
LNIVIQNLISMLQKIRIFIIRWTLAQFELLFERKVSLLYNKILKNEILLIIDIGANRGQTIEFFHKLNPKSYLYSFEPNPKLFETLEKKYKSNKSISLIQKGVSNKIETKIFYENVFDETSTFEVLNMDSQYLKKKSLILGVKPEDIVKDSYPVEVTTLSHFIETKGLQKVDILKIDTEGHEFECLEGLFQSTNSPRVKVIQFEMHFDDMYLKNRSYDDIKDLLNLNGYYEIKRIKHGFGDFYDYFYAQDNILQET